MALTTDWTAKQIVVTSPQTDVLIQDLMDYIRGEEDSTYGITREQIVVASGKEDLGGGTLTGITAEFINDWQLKFYAGDYTATISGGNLIGGISDDPVAYTAGVQVVIIQSAASTLVVTGSGVTETDKTDIAGLVWDEAISGHTSSGSFGEWAQKKLLSVAKFIGLQ